MLENMGLTAVKNNDFASLKKLFEIGLDPNTTDEKGFSLLYYAIKAKSLLMVKLICRQPDIEINLKRPVYSEDEFYIEGYNTPLEDALFEYHEKADKNKIDFLTSNQMLIIDKLISLGADADVEAFKNSCSQKYYNVVIDYLNKTSIFDNNNKTKREI